jgi:uncharacterized protein (DUF1778 family)
VRVRLRVPLQLKGTDKNGNKIEQAATTENVSLSGFLCTSAADFAPHSIVEVYMTSCKLDYVGKAKIMHASSNSAPLRHYGCFFVEKDGPWVLQ